MREISLKSKKIDYRQSEAYKILRTNIEFSGADNKVIVLTSCTPNEGKSTTAVQLSSSLADAGKKVLLIDADLRKSVMTDEFQVTGHVKGLSHFLADRADLADTMYKVKDKDMVVIFAGHVPPNPAELLSQKRFASMLVSARNVNDYIIIDAPPLGSVIDAAIIANHSDVSILVVAAQNTSRKFARLVKEQLERSGCPILGVVLNKVDIKNDKYYGKYYTHYYGEKY